MAHAKRLKPTQLVFGWVLIFASALLLTGCAGETTGGTQRVEIAGEVFKLELALDNPSRIQGLSDRDFIAPDGGMLFVFPYEDEREFVMRRCLVPIDILFLDPRGTVLNTHAMLVEPADTPERELKRYASEGKSALVIELAGGTVERLGVQAGDSIELPVLELKRRAR
ncbi:MAG: DUF192 domain-containing protein [Planctomycetota bacterium]